MKLTEYNEENGKNECAVELNDQFSKMTALQSLLIGENLSTEEIPFIKEFKCVQKFFDSPIFAKEETSFKKVFATGIIAAIDKGILPFHIEKAPEAIAATIDTGLTQAKIAYMLDKGAIDAIDAADILIDKTAARMTTLADKVIEKGVPIVAHKITQIAVRIFPPAIVVAPIIETVVNRATPLIKAFVHKGIEKVASVAKTVVRKVAQTAVKIGKKITNWIFG